LFEQFGYLQKIHWHGFLYSNLFKLIKRKRQSFPLSAITCRGIFQKWIELVQKKFRRKVYVKLWKFMIRVLKCRWISILFVSTQRSLLLFCHMFKESRTCGVSVTRKSLFKVFRTAIIHEMYAYKNPFKFDLSEGKLSCRPSYLRLTRKQVFKNLLIP
jgi:hypothetical protein